MFSFQVAENDNLPLKICLSCIEKVSIACDIKKKCIETDKFIREFLEVEPPQNEIHVKIETTESYEAYEALQESSSDDECFRAQSIRKKVKRLGKESDLSKASKCFICEQEFPLIKAKNEHVNSSHAAEKRCRICDRSCKTPIALERHTKSHFVQDCFNLCSICGHSFLKKYTLERHILQMHGEGAPLFICDLCPNWNSKFVANLRRHMSTVHLNLKKHRCPYMNTCPKKFFTTKDALNFHLTGQHNFLLLKCKNCSQRFDSEKDLQDHKVSGRCFARIVTKMNRVRKEVNKNAKESAGAEEYFCEICNLSFARKSQYSMHYTQKHKCSLTCKHCDKKISSYANLVRHIRTVHEFEKRFSCTVCEKQFSQKSSLASHKNTHTADKPFTCEQCDFRTGDRSTLIKHRKKIHS